MNTTLINTIHPRKLTQPEIPSSRNYNGNNIEFLSFIEGVIFSIENVFHKLRLNQFSNLSLISIIFLHLLEIDLFFGLQKVVTLFLPRLMQCILVK